MPSVGAERGRRLLGGALLAAYGVLWVGGLVAYLLLGGPPAHVGWTAPAFLAVAAALVLAAGPPRAGALLVAAGALGLAAEVVGLAGGHLFGVYSYTGTLGPRWLGVPLAVAAAWLVVAAYARQAALSLPLGRWGQVLAGAAWMTALDLVIDPLAAGPLGYWRWPGGGAFYGVPARNFAGWLVVGWVLQLVLSADRRRRPAVRWLGMSVLVFFTTLAGGLGLAIPALIGLVLLFSDALLARRQAGIDCRETRSG